LLASLLHFGRHPIAPQLKRVAQNAEQNATQTQKAQKQGTQGGARSVLLGITELFSLVSFPFYSISCVFSQYKALRVGTILSLFLFSLHSPLLSHNFTLNESKVPKE
jgi:hypothetical protein